MSPRHSTCSLIRGGNKCGSACLIINISAHSSAERGGKMWPIAQITEILEPSLWRTNFRSCLGFKSDYHTSICVAYRLSPFSAPTIKWRKAIHQMEQRPYWTANVLSDGQAISIDASRLSWNPLGSAGKASQLYYQGCLFQISAEISSILGFFRASSQFLHRNVGVVLQTRL
jgi:hypothetical protein